MSLTGSGPRHQYRGDVSVTPPAVEPVTAAELRAHLNGVSDTDEYLTGLITAAREEIEKLNLALEMGDNVMLYLDDIQHTHPELLQKFISLCDAQRRIEGIHGAVALAHFHRPPPGDVDPRWPSRSGWDTIRAGADDDRHPALPVRSNRARGFF